MTPRAFYLWAVWLGAVCVVAMGFVFGRIG